MPKKIPKQFWPYFWDVDPRKVDPAKKTDFVIERLLDKGNTRAVSWVLKHFSTQTIKKTFATLRDFSPRIGNFWKLFLKIPDDKILCLQEPYRMARKSHWPF